MTEFEVQKLRSAMLFILNKKGSIDIFRLFKILYFADRQHMAEYGRRIISDTFCAFENGPVPTVLYDILNNPERMAAIKQEYSIFLNSFTRGSNDARHYVFPETNINKEEYESYLSKSDIKCLDKSFDENINLSFGELSSKSHDIAWNEVWNVNGRRNNPMNPYVSAKAEGANDDMIEYMEEMDEIADYLMAN